MKARVVTLEMWSGQLERRRGGRCVASEVGGSIVAAQVSFSISAFFHGLLP